MSIYFSLFWQFAQIGTFTLGGGYAMLPLMQRALVDKKKYLSEQDFLDAAALAQAAPGIMAVNMAVITGKKIAGFAGSACAALGAAGPAFVIILLAAVCLRHWPSAAAQHIFRALRPAVAALIFVPVFTLARGAGVNKKNVWAVVLAAAAVWLAHVSPVYVILIAGAAAYVCGRGKPDTDKDRALRKEVRQIIKEHQTEFDELANK